jgi:hypothetical protein
MFMPPVEGCVSGQRARRRWSRAFGRACEHLEPCVILFCLTIILRLLRLMAVPHRAPPQLAGEQVAIKVTEAGRYLEVGSDGWLYASSFSHNRHSARFHVDPVSPEMLRSLVATREFDEHAELTSGYWDMRPKAGGELWEDTAVDPDAQDASDVYVEPALPAGAEPPWQRLARAAEQGASGWVVLRSAYAGGYVEVVGRGEEPQYVVRIAAGGRLSYRSLFLISDEALWSQWVARQPSNPRPRPDAPPGPLPTL